MIYLHLLVTLNHPVRTGTLQQTHAPGPQDQQAGAAAPLGSSRKQGWGWDGSTRKEHTNTLEQTRDQPATGAGTALPLRPHAAAARGQARARHGLSSRRCRAPGSAATAPQRPTSWPATPPAAPSPLGRRRPGPGTCGRRRRPGPGGARRSPPPGAAPGCAASAAGRRPAVGNQAAEQAKVSHAGWHDAATGRQRPGRGSK